jgi:ATP-dependent DNA ligase
VDSDPGRSAAQLISHIYLLEPNPEEPATPPVYMAFDCLYRNGRDLRGKPLSHRRAALEDVIGDGITSTQPVGSRLTAGRLGRSETALV